MKVREFLLQFRVLSILTALGFVYGCGSDDLVAPPATIESFIATPDHLVGEGTTTLSWKTTDAVSVSITQDGEALSTGDQAAEEGSIEVTLSQTATFELIARGQENTAKSQLTVEVLPNPAPVIASFEAPEVLAADEAGTAIATLRWTGVEGADELILESTTLAAIALDLTATPDGTHEVELTEDTTFTLIARNAGGETERVATTRVVPFPTIETFAASRHWIGLGEETRLSWQVSGAARVELWIDGLQVDDGALDPADGSYDLTALMDTTAELRAFSELDAMTSESLEVIVAPPGIELFAGNELGAWLGQTLELSWITHGGRHLELTLAGEETPIFESDDLAVVDASTFSLEELAEGDYTFTLTVNNGSGTVSEPLLLTVGTGPVITRFTVEPADVSPGGEVAIRWEVDPDPLGEEATLSLVDDRGNTYTAEATTGTLNLTLEDLGDHVFTLVASTTHSLSIPAQAEATASVHALPAVTLAASPLHFDSAEVEHITFSWTSENASSLILSRLEGSLPAAELLVVSEAEFASGSFDYVPEDEGTYRMVAANPAGSEAFAEVTVTMAPPRIVRFEADKEEIVAGEELTLSWDVEMARDLELSFIADGYLVEDRPGDYFDLEAQGGSLLPMTIECKTSTTNPALDTSACAVLEFPEGFTFPFDGVEQTKLRVYQGGVLSFDWATAQTSPAGNATLPTTAANKEFVDLAPFWDSLMWPPEKYEEGNLFYLYRPDPVLDSFVIQWKDISLAGSNNYPTTSLNFEVVLWANGDFEYRYGTMESYTNQAWAYGGSATIGFQEKALGISRMLNYNSNLAVRGPLENRTFRFSKQTELPLSGTLSLFPYASEDLNQVSLVASRGDLSATETLSINVRSRARVEITQRPLEPVATGSDFRIAWTAKDASLLVILDGDLEEVCRAELPAQIEEGFCNIREERQGEHAYRIRATGALGSVTERVFPITAFDDFGILSFEANPESVEIGQGLTLTWETYNVSSVSLQANGLELLPQGAPSGPGSFDFPAVTADTTFVLRVTNTMGMVREEERVVETWRISFDVATTETDVRPGDPITVTVSAASLDGGPAPRVYGTFPLVEDTSPGAKYVDISLLETSEQHSLGYRDDTAAFEIIFPDGFSFPYFGTEHHSIRAALDGFLSFNTSTSAPYANTDLPNNTALNAGNVHIAPFWDDLHVRENGEMWSGPLDPDTFVIQWKKMSMSTGSSNSTTTRDAIPHDLNFQVVLHRDGTFEYRYGAMDPLTPPATSTSCYPNTCVNEANGSAATIGYQNVDGTIGHMLHHGAMYPYSDDARPFDGGLSNRTFVSKPLVGNGVVTFQPTMPGTYVFCSMSGDREVCRSFDVKTEFRLLDFRASAPAIGFGSKVTLSWNSRGGKEVVIRNHGEEVYRTADIGEVDEGSVELEPVLNAHYELELIAPGNSATMDLTVEVIRLSLTASASPTSVFPGEPTTLSWNLTVHDPAFDPVLITPMEEITGTGPGLTFADLDLYDQPDVIIVHETTNTTGISGAIKEVPFGGGFKFNYLGTDMDWVRISTEGYLSFDSTATSASGSNQLLPNSATAYKRVHIAPFWEDLHTRIRGKVLAKLVNPDTFVVQWSQTSLNYGSSTADQGNLNFMVVLHRNGDFEFRYGPMQPQIEPASNATHCYPNTCEWESNGSSATIGYQDVTGTAASLVHFGGTNRAATQLPVPRGLEGRTWKFTQHRASGSAVLKPWSTQEQKICAVDTVTGDVYCSDPVEMEAIWEIAAFDATPTPFLRDQAVTLSWDVEGLDILRILADGNVLQTYTREDMPLTGSLNHTPNKTTTYTLEGSSLGRELRVEKVAELRALTMNLQAPTGRLFPGDVVSIDWELEQLEPGPFAVTTPMIEIDAGPGQPGEYKSIAGLDGAVQPILVGTGAGASATVDLPFSFPYFGSFREQVQIYVYGYLSFDISTASGRATNQPLPTAPADSRIHLAPFWDQMFMRGSDAIWVYQQDPDTFIVEYANFNRAGGSSAGANPVLYDLNFQVHLKRDGSFEFRYGKMDPPPPPNIASTCYPGTCELEANGSSATIGYQTMDGSYGYTFTYGGNTAATVREVPGGLRNRTLRFQPTKTGTSQFVVGENDVVTICGTVGEFKDCSSIEVTPVAKPGDLMITELMIDPAGGAANQWFEVRNLSKGFIDLDGFDIKTTTGSHKITGPLLVGTGEYLTFAASASAGFTPSHVYGTGIPFNTLSETLSIEAGTSRIASVSWGVDWSVPSGTTLYLEPGLQHHGIPSNDDPESWCPGTAAGSPGSRDPSCQHPIYDVEVNSTRPFIDISTIGTRLSGVENSYGIVELPIRSFPMPFFDGTVETMWATAWGFLSFASERPGVPADDYGYTGTSPYILPRVSNLPTGPILGAFWDSLQCAPASYNCSFHHYRGEIDGQEVVIVQWTNYRRNLGVGSLTFQAQLWLDGTIVIAFADVDSDDPAGSSNWNYYHGGLAWIALEGADQSYITGLHRTVTDLSHRTIVFTRK